MGALMADVMTRAQRRFNMSRVRGKGTQPELMLRRGLHRRGLRYRLHGKDLPGRPDLVLPGRKAVILVHGCFWHMHDCPRFKWPSTREKFWRAKILRNHERDRKVLEELRQAGWRVQIVWECALRGSGRRPLDEVLDACEAFVDGGQNAVAEIGGNWDRCANDLA